ncbi:MAG: RsmB/NOP family class I SAM-dependent RNA methyltransferase [Pseudomonadota bacterium]
MAKRRASRLDSRSPSLPEVLPAQLADAADLWGAVTAVYGERATEVAHGMRAPGPELCFWVNPLHPKHGRFEPPGKRLALPASWYAGGGQAVFAAPREFTHEALAGSGMVWIQNLASMFVVTQLGVQANEEILDLAAAPGGKTLAIAAAMGGAGRLAAVEPIKNRFHRMQANFARCGVEVACYQRDGRGVGKATPERFDRVLLDAPCSSQARMRWSAPASFAHWRRGKVKEMQRKQKSLLRSAYAALKPGGVLVYSTCSFAPEENELVVAHLLRKTTAQILPLQDHGFEMVPGLSVFAGKALPSILSQTGHLLPSELVDGFYVARIAKPAS